MSLENKIYLYPQTNAPCGFCQKAERSIKKGVPSSLSIPNCSIPAYFNCGDRVALNDKVVYPDCDNNKKSNSITTINPQLYTQQVSNSFREKNRKPTSACPTDKVWTSQDARLYSAIRGEYLDLSERPTETKIKLKDLYIDKNLNSYGQKYRTYSDINAGQISYYIDKDLKSPYFPPNFPNSKKNPVPYNPQLYKDPMDNFKPEYLRLFPERNPITEPTSNADDSYCLKDLQNTTNFREDILTCQMSKRNQNRWEPRWANDFLSAIDPKE